MGRGEVMIEFSLRSARGARKRGPAMRRDETSDRTSGGGGGRGREGRTELAEALERIPAERVGRERARVLLDRLGRLVAAVVERRLSEVLGRLALARRGRRVRQVDPCRERKQAARRRGTFGPVSPASHEGGSSQLDRSGSSSAAAAGSDGPERGTPVVDDDDDDDDVTPGLATSDLAAAAAAAAAFRPTSPSQAPSLQRPICRQASWPSSTSAASPVRTIAPWTRWRAEPGWPQASNARPYRSRPVWSSSAGGCGCCCCCCRRLGPGPPKGVVSPATPAEKAVAAAAAAAAAGSGDGLGESGRRSEWRSELSRRPVREAGPCDWARWVNRPTRSAEGPAAAAACCCCGGGGGGGSGGWAGVKRCEPLLLRPDDMLQGGLRSLCSC